MNTIDIKQHDTKIIFTDTPTIDGAPMTSGDLSGCTVSFLLKGRAKDGSNVAIKSAATITGDAKFNYAPADSDVAKAGRFHQEWELVFPSGKILTFPNDIANVVNVIEDLG